MLHCGANTRAGDLTMTTCNPCDPATGQQREIRILIVEDHAPTSKAVTELLLGTLGREPALNRPLTVATVQDAETALERIASDPPDMVLMDIGLAGMNGIEATRRIRNIAPAVPVIIHSRSDTEVYRARAAAAGASGFVSKQRTAEELGPMALSLLARTADHACDTQPRGRRS